jgi:signal recognition particle subunit SRP54
MFENLTTRLGQVFEKLRGRGALTEADVDAALREVRVALLEADVALPVVKDFLAHVRAKAVGQDVLRSVTPGQLVIKVVYDELVTMLGSATAALSFQAEPPVPVLMVGLQGSGKTTTTAKLGVRLEKQDKRKVLMASLDVYRPAAQEQLRVLGEQTGVAVLPVIEGQQPVDIAKRALNAAKLRGMDVVLLDTAGRLTIDEAMMREAAAVKDAVRPTEVLLVADSLTGQDAVNTAKAFKDRLNITGIVLTRIDGDARGGAALSMRQTAGAPIKLIGTGEKMDALEPFYPDRIASRILGMGDVVSLVEKAKETIDQEEAAKLEAKVMAGGFDMNDLLSQLRQMRKMGGMEGLLAMLPGVGQMKAATAANRIDDKMIARQEAIILSMTTEERRKVQILNARRRQRIAAGSGTTVADVNKLLKQHRTMADMFKKVGKLGKKGMARMRAGMGGGTGGFGGGGLPPGFGR